MSTRQDELALVTFEDIDERTLDAEVDAAGVAEVDFGPPPQGFIWLVDNLMIVLATGVTGSNVFIYSGGSKGDASFGNVRDSALTTAGGTDLGVARAICRGEYPPNGLLVAPGRRLRVRVTGGLAAGIRMTVTFQSRLTRKRA